MTSSIDKIIEVHEDTHGTWRQNAGCCHAIWTAISIWKTRTLEAFQSVALYQICVKVARICCGDPNHIDSWEDIAGYATLVATELRRRAAERASPSPESSAAAAAVAGEVQRFPMDGYWSGT